MNLQERMLRTDNPVKWLYLQHKLKKLENQKNLMHVKKQQKISNSVFHNRVCCGDDHIQCFIILGGITTPVVFRLSETLKQVCFRYRLNASLMWFTLNSKPLKDDVPLMEYGIYTNASIVANSRLLGGSSDYYLYTHVRDCERQCLLETSYIARKFNLQAQDDSEQIERDITQLFERLAKIKSSISSNKLWVIDLFESFFQIYYWFRKCETMTDFGALTCLAYKVLTGRSTSTTIWKLLTKSDDNLQANFADHVKTARSVFDNVSKTMNNPLLDKMRAIYTYLLIQGFFAKMGLTIDEEEFLRLHKKTRVESTDGTNFITNVVETAIVMCERYVQYKVTGDWTSLIHGEASYHAWANEADRLLNLAPYTSNLAAHGTTYFSFIADLNDAVEKGEAICKFTRSHNGTDGVFLSRKLNNLLMLKNMEVTRRAAQKERKAPFGVLVHGGSSVAKSTFTKLLFYYYGKLHGEKTDDHYRYVRNPTDEYWSNFDSSKWCIQMDDIAFLLPAKSADVDATLKEMLNVVNNVPYVPPQAALEDKGKTPVMAKLVIATTNAEHLNAQDYFHCPLAVRRRLPFVVNIVPKEEYLAENRKFIDPSKLPTMTDAQFPDFWNIKLQRLVPTDYMGRDSATLETVREFTDIREFLKVYAKASLDHEETQEKSGVCDSEMSKVHVCRFCFESGGKCDCLQADDRTWYQICQYKLAAYGCSIASWWLHWLFYFSIVDKMMKYRFTRWIILRSTDYLDFKTQLYVLTRVNVTDGDVEFNHKMRQFIEISKIVLVFTASFTLGHIVTRTVTNCTQRVVRACGKKFGDKVEKKVPTNPFDGFNDPNDHPECDPFAGNYYEPDEKLMYEPQGNVMGTTEDQLQKEEKQNVWYNPTLELSRFDVPVASSSMSSLTQAQIRDYVSNNCVALIIEATDVEYRCRTRGVFVKGQMLVFNRHTLRSGFRFRMTIIASRVCEGINSNVTFTFTRDECKFDARLDMVALRVLCVPPRKNITKIWCNKDIPISTLISVGRDQSGAVGFRQHYRIVYYPHFPVEALNNEMPMYLTTCEVKPEKGDCGSLAIAVTPIGPVIIGLHTIGYENQVGYTHIRLQDLEELVGDTPCVTAGEQPKFSVQGDIELTQPHHRSMFRYMNSGTLNVYGSLPGFRAKPKSRVCATIKQAEMLEHFNEQVRYGRPVVAGWEPWKLNVAPMIQPNLNHDQSILNACVDSFYNDIVLGLDHMDAGWRGQLVFLSDRAAVNGLPGVIYIDAINKNSSMGFPCNTSKKQFLVSAPSEKYPDGVDFPQEIWDRVDAIKASYKEGKRVYPIFSGHLKDEAVSFAKIEAKKTRVFTGAPIDWSLVVRSRLLSFVRLLQNNKFVFEAGPGTVCQSREWTDVYNYLTAFGCDQIVAGDYSKFDKRMTAPFILAAFDIIKRIYREAGFTDEELLEIECIAHDTAFPVVNMNGDIVEFFGTNPSGHPLTVIINSLANSLYVRYAYSLANPESPQCCDFNQNVHLFTYGDDNIMGISKDIPWFNHTVIQSKLATIGVEYTMADKEAETVPYIHIDECQFLKRKWRWEPELEAYTCPLELDSIVKSLTVWVSSTTLCPEEQMVKVISSANSEFFFYGREVFEHHHNFFRSILDEYPYSKFVTDSTLPGWLDLCTRFRRASESE